MKRRKERNRKANFLTHLEQEVSSRQKFCCKSVRRRRFHSILHSRLLNHFRWRSFQWWNKSMQLVSPDLLTDFRREEDLSVFSTLNIPPAGSTSNWWAYSTFEVAFLKPLIKNSSWIKRGARWLAFKCHTSSYTKHIQFYLAYKVTLSSHI